MAESLSQSFARTLTQLQRVHFRGFFSGLAIRANNNNTVCLFCCLLFCLFVFVYVYCVDFILLK